MRENRVEPRGPGQWVVIGHSRCPTCGAECDLQLDIPEAFLLLLINEGERRERERQVAAAVVREVTEEGGGAS